MITAKRSKTLDNLMKKHPDKIESWHCEVEDDDVLVYWVYLRKPWVNDDLLVIAETKIRDILRAFKNIEKNPEIWEM